MEQEEQEIRNQISKNKSYRFERECLKVENKKLRNEIIQADSSLKDYTETLMIYNYQIKKLNQPL